MEVHLTPEQEARLAALAARDGRTTDEIAREAIDRYIGDDGRFIAAVVKGLASLDQGEFLSHADVRQRIDRMFSG